MLLLDLAPSPKVEWFGVDYTGSITIDLAGLGPVARAMTVDGASIASRLRALIPEGEPVLHLVGQLSDGMPDAEYQLLAVAIARSIATRQRTDPLSMDRASRVGLKNGAALHTGSFDSDGVGQPRETTAAQVGLSSSPLSRISQSSPEEHVRQSDPVEAEIELPPRGGPSGAAEHGFRVKGGARRPTVAEVKWMKSLRSLDFSIRLIARATGFSHGTVANYLRGVRAPKPDPLDLAGGQLE